MTKVDEKPWIRECPRCGDTSPTNQNPVAAGGPCQHCRKPAWPLNMILFYQCQSCKTRYLTPRIELTKEEVAKLKKRMEALKAKLSGYETGESLG